MVTGIFVPLDRRLVARFRVAEQRLAVGAPDGAIRAETPLEHSQQDRIAVYVVEDPHLALSRVKPMRPSRWTSLPFQDIARARKSVSSRGSSKPLPM